MSRSPVFRVPVVGSVFAHSQVFRSRGSILRMRNTDYGEKEGQQFISSTLRRPLSCLSTDKVASSSRCQVYLQSSVGSGAVPGTRLHILGAATGLW